MLRFILTEILAVGDILTSVKNKLKLLRWADFNKMFFKLLFCFVLFVCLFVLNVLAHYVEERYTYISLQYGLTLKNLKQTKLFTYS